MQHDVLMGGDDESEYSTTPPARPRRPTISYAQATKRLSFQQETIFTDSKKKHAGKLNTNHDDNNVYADSKQFNDAINSLRQETERYINSSRREELKTEVKSKANTNTMEEDKLETASNASSDTATTTKSMIDRIDSLTQMVQLLAEKVHEVVENQEVNAQKRARSFEPRQILRSPSRPPDTDATHSPPAKLSSPSARANSPKPPPLPPNGIPKNTGTQEEI